MKNKLLAILTSLLISCLCMSGLVACDTIKLKLNFVVDNEVYYTIETNGNEMISMPQNPEKTGYVFDGWFWDKDVWSQPFTANSLLDAPLSSDMNVYAKFIIEHVHTYLEDVIEPTCEEQGYTTYTCDCGDVYVGNYVDALNHNYGEWISNGNGKHYKTCINDSNHKVTEVCSGGIATCTNKAVCINCKTAYGNYADHIPESTWQITEEYHYKNCTYSECNAKVNYGVHEYDNNNKCSICDYVAIGLVGTEISSEIYEIDGNNLFVKVPNSQSSFSFANTIKVAPNATYKVYTDISCNNLYNIASYAVNDLKVGNNVYYILVTNGQLIPQVYTVTVRRKPNYEIAFNTNGGSSIQKQIVEEDGFIIEPNSPTKLGYSFLGWNYNFENPVTENLTVSANWKINKYTLTIVCDNGQENIVITQNYNSSIRNI